MDSPAGSALPLSWLPQEGPQLDMTEEEPDEALGNPEAEEVGKRIPQLEEEGKLSSEGDRNTCPMTLGPTQACGWVASGLQGDGNRLPEHSKIKPSVELSSARSWSSGTVSLGHPSDSLDSPWEGDLDDPGPPALAETSPPSPSKQLPTPDDRIGGPVVPVTPPEFQDTAAPAPSVQLSTGRWSRATGSISCPQPQNQTWKRTKTILKPLPSRFTGSISPMNPRPRANQKDKMPPKQGATLASHSSSDVPKYGRGQLNYPLPDFSKVGPRVKFPKDESYRPPKSRSHRGQPQGPAGPLIFKSPAEIVREVLLSGGEASPQKDPSPAHAITRVPQEFQTPEQATELVHQLQVSWTQFLRCCQGFCCWARVEAVGEKVRVGARSPLSQDEG